MGAFGQFWNANALMIGIGCTVLAVLAAFLQFGQVATVLGMIGGIAFMWLAPAAPPVDTDEEAG
jgi:hypothetical protein